MTSGTGDLVSTPSEMNPLETMMWRAEVDPRLRSPVIILDVLDTAPDWDRVVASHEWATRFVPRLRDRVLEPWGDWGTPAWVPDPDFALPHHLGRDEVALPGGRRELLDLAASMALTPFDRERPPWEARIVTGLEGGRAAYVLKVHHSVVDGLGLVQILRMLHSGVREHTVHPDHPEPDRHGPSRLGLTVTQATRAVAGVPARAAGVVSAGAGLLGRLVTRPLATVSDGSAFLGSALRAAVGPVVPRSPLLRGRSLDRRFESLDVDLGTLKAAGRAAGGSLNDAYLAALLGGMRRYHQRFGAIPGHLAMGMPVNTRDRDDPVGGNHWAGTRFAAPLGDVDPADRILHVREIVRRTTGERVVDGLGLIAPLLAVLPPPLLALIQGGATSANDLQASNVPGMTGPAYLAGARIVRSYAFAPLPGGAAMTTLTSHGDTCCVAVTLDPAAITDPDAFLEDLRAGFAEVLALAPTR